MKAFPPLALLFMIIPGNSIYLRRAGINYAPTRGCYWNRCTFCDYGLNTDKPTSPWRERKIDQCISDLKEAQAKYGVRYVYFAVDVMSPTYLERLSDAILALYFLISAGAPSLKWENLFRGALQEDGKGRLHLRVAGMESGNQRILDLIDKGTSIAYMSQTMKNFALAGIACQLMAFTDFPTETPEEKKETFDFVSENDAVPVYRRAGYISLTHRNVKMTAKNPSRFGITVVETQDCDVSRAVSYTVSRQKRGKGLHWRKMPDMRPSMIPAAFFHLCSEDPGPAEVTRSIQ